jgi:hypothetical protein
MWTDANLDQLGEGVWWAGVEAAPVWLDVARDYSEDWVHHQQIRDAVERPGLSSPEFLDPLLDTLMRAIPKTYEPVHADDGTTVVVVLSDGSRSLSWSLVMDIGCGGRYSEHQIVGSDGSRWSFPQTRSGDSQPAMSHGRKQ